MTRTALILVFICLGLAFLPTPAVKADISGLSRANELFHKGEFDAALRETAGLRDVLDPGAPNYAGVMARLLWQEAQIYGARGDLLAALERADESVEHASSVADPTSVISAIYRGERGKILLKLGVLEQAQTEFEFAVSILSEKPEHTEIHLDMYRHLALTLSERGEVGAAHDIFSDLVDRRREAADASALASVLIDLAGTTLRRGAQGLENAEMAAELASEADKLLPQQDGMLRGEWLVLQGRIALQRSQLARAEETFAQAAEIFDDPLRQAHARLLQAQVHMLRGNAMQSEQLHIAAMKDIRSGLGQQHPVLARTLVGLGLVNADLGRPSEAISYLLRAIRIFEDSAGIGTAPAAEARVELAMIFNQVGEYDSARSVAESALETLSQGGSDLRVAYAHSALGFALDGVGEAAAAIEHLETALRDIGRLRGQDSSDLAPGLIRLASIKTELGVAGLPEADAHLREAFRLMEKDTASGPRLVAAAREVQLRLLERSGKLDQVTARARNAIDYLKTEDRPSAGTCDMRPTEVAARHKLLTTAIDILAHTEDPLPSLVAELFDGAQLAHSGAAARAILQSARTRVGDPHKRQLLVELEATGTERCALDRQLLHGISGVARGIQVSRSVVEARIAELSARISELSTQFEEGVKHETPDVAHAPVDAVMSQLHDGEGMVLQLTGDRGTHLFWIDKTGVEHRQTPLTNTQLSDHVRRLRTSIDIANSNPDDGLPPVPLDAAHALYSGILEPFEELMLMSRTVFFVADGAARSLPVSMFLTRDYGPRHLSDPLALADLAWLGEQQAISVIPSPAALVALRRQGDRGAGRVEFVGVGNPTFERASYALPETERELQELAHELSATPGAILVTGSDATEAWVRTSPEVREARVLAFATHGLLNKELGTTEPALMLAPPSHSTGDDDGFLTASEIAMLDLKADWVILSACNTAAGRDARAEGLSGLAGSFFEAGARSLLVSHWYVPSAAAGALTVFTAQALSKPGTGRAEALRQAMRRVRGGATLEGPRNPRFGHPAYWAPFVVVGETV